MGLIDDFLNSITMYRLMLYVLIVFLAVALSLTFFKILPFDPLNLFFSAVFLILICWITNKILAIFLNVPTNFESVYITALILTLIITPATNFHDFLFLGLIGVCSQVSKYALAIKKKHIFNPAAFSVALSFLFFKFGASWWIGNQYMLIPVLIGGLLVVRKLQRFNLILSFLVFYSIFIVGNSVRMGNRLTPSIFLESPIFFFAFIMLTEPQTTPPTKILQIFYGSLVGVGSTQFSLEIALILGNVFSYIVSPKEKLLLKLKEKIQLAPSIYDFVFKLDKQSLRDESLKQSLRPNGLKPFTYNAGQYMEWTLGHKNPDSRGVRRYFTLAASPTEGNLRIGVKFYPNGSSFKNSLINMKPGDQIVASSLSGEFTLPKDSEKLCFIAGGIGITPFRSMIKYLLDANQKKDIILLYSNKTALDIVYKDIFDQAFQKLGIKTVYVNTDTQEFIDDKKIVNEVQDFKDRTFYISGPHSMVDVFEKILKGMGIPGSQIKIDFFPGYA